MSANVKDGEIEYSVAKCSSVPNIHIKCKPETVVPDLFVINTQASSCTDKTESTVASNEDLISKGHAIYTKDKLKVINVGNSCEVSQGNCSGSVNVEKTQDTNVNRMSECRNSSDTVSWIDKNKDHEQEELLRASEVINRRNKRIMKQSFNTSDMLIISDSNIHNNNVKKKDVNNSKRVPTALVSDAEPAVDCWEDLLNENDPIHAGVTLEV